MASARNLPDAGPPGELPGSSDRHADCSATPGLASPSYGGNKVRTLQHQLAVCESKIASGSPKRELVIFGSGGSNQIVATLVHGLHRLRLRVYPLWGVADPPDLDNTLNMLSSLSFPMPGCQTWGRAAGVLFKLLSAIVRGSGFLFPPGGNNPAGVLGQAAGPLELAEQIGRGELPDVARYPGSSSASPSCASSACLRSSHQTSSCMQCPSTTRCQLSTASLACTRRSGAHTCR